MQCVIEVDAFWIRNQFCIPLIKLFVWFYFIDIPNWIEFFFAQKCDCTVPLLFSFKLHRFKIEIFYAKVITNKTKQNEKFHSQIWCDEIQNMQKQKMWAQTYADYIVCFDSSVTWFYFLSSYFICQSVHCHVCSSLCSLSANLSLKSSFLCALFCFSN